MRKIEKPYISTLKTIGSGSEFVYAYGFPSQKAGDAWPCKIGRSKRNPIWRIIDQQASMQERPEIWLMIKTDNSRHVERLLHIALADRRLPTFGREWFSTSPDAIEQHLAGNITAHLFGDSIRLARHSAGLSQGQLAVKANVRQGTVSSIECGKGTIATAAIICEALGKRLTITDL